MTPTINFYVLETANRQQSWLFACELLEKAYHDQQTVFVQTESKEAAAHLDLLLWTYRDDSFVPHQLYTQHASPPPIQIGYGDIPQSNSTTLLNLSSTIPTCYTAFSRVIEIVYADAAMQHLARERFRYYREQGCHLDTVKLATNAV
jgi:DNA polymerase-3 subunit chi